MTACSTSTRRTAPRPCSPASSTSTCRRRAPARALLRAGSVEPVRLHDRRERGREQRWPHTLKYGTTSPHVLELEVVSAGRECSSGSGRRDGHAHGYDLRGAFVGSEERSASCARRPCDWFPCPRPVSTVLAGFTSLRDACSAVSTIIARGIVPAAARAPRRPHDRRGRGVRLRGGATAETRARALDRARRNGRRRPARARSHSRHLRRSEPRSKCASRATRRSGSRCGAAARGAFGADGQASHRICTCTSRRASDEAPRRGRRDQPRCEFARDPHREHPARG